MSLKAGVVAQRGGEGLIVPLLFQHKNERVTKKASRFRMSETRWLFTKCIVKLWGSLQEDIAPGGYMGLGSS